MQFLTLLFFLSSALAIFPDWARNRLFSEGEAEFFNHCSKQTEQKLREWLHFYRFFIDKNLNQYNNQHFSISEDGVKQPLHTREEALKIVFIIQNAILEKSKYPHFIVELHGQDPETVSVFLAPLIEAATEHYKESNWSPKEAFLYFLTGRGLHSRNFLQSPLQATVKQFAQDNNCTLDAVQNQGVVAVRLNRESDSQNEANPVRAYYYVALPNSSLSAKSSRGNSSQSDVTTTDYSDSEILRRGTTIALNNKNLLASKKQRNVPRFLPPSSGPAWGGQNLALKKSIVKEDLDSTLVGEEKK